jgi:hypothetical protein
MSRFELQLVIRIKIAAFVYNFILILLVFKCPESLKQIKGRLFLHDVRPKNLRSLHCCWPRNEERSHSGIFVPEKQGAFMKLITTFSLVMTLMLSACGSREKKPEPTAEPHRTLAEVMSPEQVQQITEDWSPKHRQIIQRMVSKYGQPDESTSDMLIWNNNGPWIRTVVKKHDMNRPLSQTASLEVPPEKLGEVALFNRSIVVDSNNDMVTSSAAREELNFLALNLTKEIADENMSPMEARRQYSQLTSVSDRANLMDDLHFRRGSQPAEAQEAEEGQ